MTRFLLVVDISATIVFALEGGLAGAKAGLDLLGILVLAGATALGGGIIRDVLIGAIPPQAIRDWRYPAAALLAGASVVVLDRSIAITPPIVLIVLDAAGLSLFAIAGAQKALVYELNPLMATIMGGITAAGGGTIRDVFLGQIPAVLRTDIYATAALAGAAAMVGARRLGVSPPVSAVIGGVLCFTLRMVAVWQHWNLPKL
jgi:uncharacterized membrane protein YeiH